MREPIRRLNNGSQSAGNQSARVSASSASAAPSTHRAHRGTACRAPGSRSHTPPPAAPVDTCRQAAEEQGGLRGAASTCQPPPLLPLDRLQLSLPAKSIFAAISAAAGGNRALNIDAPGAQEAGAQVAKARLAEGLGPALTTYAHPNLLQPGLHCAGPGSSRSGRPAAPLQAVASSRSGRRARRLLLIVCRTDSSRPRRQGRPRRHMHTDVHVPRPSRRPAHPSVRSMGWLNLQPALMPYFRVITELHPCPDTCLAGWSSAAAATSPPPQKQTSASSPVITHAR